MNLRPRTWALISAALFIAAGYFWHLGNERAARHRQSAAPATNATAPAPVPATPGAKAPAERGSTSAAQPVSTVEPRFASATTNRYWYRLSNTPEPIRSFIRNERALVLRNAHIDTARGAALPIPRHLRAEGEAGSYIVQSRAAITPAYRKSLVDAGADVVAYIPNNAYLVRADGAVAGRLQALSGTAAVLPFEPYYKLDPSLLGRAVEQMPLPEGSVLNVVLFPGQRESALAGLRQLQASVIEEEQTPFGPLLTVQTRGMALPEIARLAAVQLVEPYLERRPANDLTRAVLRVNDPPTNTVGAANNYLGLQGENVIVNINDTGVDSTHPDMAGRLDGDTPLALGDADGHGTHVAGTILGDGTASGTVPPGAALGSAAGANFRGMAPKARGFAMTFIGADQYLQEQAALFSTNGQRVRISNNSWTYGGGYNIHSASFDAATRDSVIGLTNPQPMLFVFAAGDNGGGDADGQGGVPDTVGAPGTAKNVITVGATELLRGITNEVTIVYPDGSTNVSTPWAGMTDSSNAVAGFSSRGNTGVAREDTYGRFKPDVVAPGAMLISCKPTNWMLRIPPTQTSHTEAYNGVFAPAHSTNLYSLSVMAADPLAFIVNVTPNAQSPNPFPSLPIDIAMGAPPPPALVSGNNTATLTPPQLTNGIAFYTIVNPTDQGVWFDLSATLIWTNNPGDYWQVLSNLNHSLGDHYRYEWGSSMAAAAVSGVLALMEEYFNDLGLSNSPALMKALLINGSRTLPGQEYGFNPDDIRPNIQGWGLVNLTNTVPANAANSGASATVQFIDQEVTNSLATGGSQTRTLSIQPTSRGLYPLRLTLAWTDPAGNPAAGIKLVNDLDLVVTNLDNQTEVYVGNQFTEGSIYSRPIGVSVANDTNGVPTSTNMMASNFVAALDIVNNVENIYIRPPLASKYSVTVRARRTHVNAVDAYSPSQIVQDYALVASCGVSNFGGGLSFDSGGQPVTSFGPEVTVKPYNTNVYTLLSERVGANPPFITNRLGLREQWNFYVFSNATTFSNVVFMTFMPNNLAFLQPNQASSIGGNPPAPRSKEADIDLYVSTNPALTNLDAAVLSTADRSVGRLGTEMVLYTNVAPGQTYYAAVKSEDQQAAEYAFFALASQNFSGLDSNGNQVVYGYPVVIPDGTPDQPGGTTMVAIATFPMTIQRVTVTNVLAHELSGDLIATLSHPSGESSGDDSFAVLFNHRGFVEEGAYSETNIYDDSMRGDLPPGLAQAPDGPGTLRNFIGEEAFGPWFFDVVDNAMNHTGRVEELVITIEPVPLTNDPTRPYAIGAGGWLYSGVDVPGDATNLHVCVSDITGPVQLYLRKGDFPTQADYDKVLYVTPPGGCLDWNIYEDPPLTPGRYYIGVYNPGTAGITVKLSIEVQRMLLSTPLAVFEQTNSTRILDDAMTNTVFSATTNGTAILVTDNKQVAMIQVGVRIDHPRASDLVLHLINPQGTRLLLAENRGWTNELGYGAAVTSVHTNWVSAVMEDGFEHTPGGRNVPAGTIMSGWLVGTDWVDVLTSGGPFGNAHSGTNFIDINGSLPSILTTNIQTKPGTSYVLGWAYTKNPWIGATNVQADVVFNGQTNHVTYTNENSGVNLGWIATSVVVHASSTTSRLDLVGTFPISGPEASAGVFFDSFQLNEIITNRFRYAFFTEDLRLTRTPIKFGEPPYASTLPYFTNLIQGGFETVAAGTYLAGNRVEEWTVLTNRVSVISDPVLAYASNQLLALSSAQISCTVTTVPGYEYKIILAHRDAGVKAWWPGDSNATDILGGHGGILSAGSTFTNGLVGPAFHFDGTVSSRVRVPASPALDVGQGRGFTIESWVKPTLVSRGYPVIEWSLTSAGFTKGVQLWLNQQTAGNGSLYANIVSGPGAAGSHVIHSPSGLIQSNMFQHVALTYDAFQQRAVLFLNGNPVAVTNFGSGYFLPRTGYDLYIGGVSNNTVFSGLIDEPSLFDRPLSEAEVWGIYNAAANGKNDRFTPAPNFSVAIIGQRTNDVISSTRWELATITFVADSANTTIRLDGHPMGVLLDGIEIIETGNRYYLPEEPLTPMFGQNASGIWQLEIWDNRLSQAVTNADLVAWQLQLGYITVNSATTIRLTNGVAHTLTLTNDPSGDVIYYSYENRCTNGWVTNTLTANGAVHVVFNQDQLPGTAGGDIPVGNYPNGVTNAQFVFDIPPLLATRYYLAVYLDGTNDTTITLQVDASCAPTNKSGPAIKAFSPGWWSRGLAMQWQDHPTAKFIVQYTESLDTPHWITVPGVITSTDGNFTFVDDGSYQAITDAGTYSLPMSSEGYTISYEPAYAPNRFYRVLKIK